jgi:diguanylate cyclase (GGDEF)-like protein
LRSQILAYGQRYDIQTGLLNYQAFQEALASLLSRKVGKLEVATVWIDILNLRREFSLWGWEAAEAMARNVANVLRAAAGGEILMGRFSGHSFVFSMEASKSDLLARQRIQRVIDALSMGGRRGTEVAPAVAAGVAFYPADARTAQDMMRFASVAAARAGESGSASVLAFEPGMNNELIRHRRVEVAIGKAFDRDEVSMVFQPKVNLVTGAVLGAEALMRWTHPDWGVVSPSEFIPVTESSHLIQRVFDFSLRTALKEVRLWQKLGIAPSIISVNVSAANLRREDFSRRVRNLLTEFPISPIELELEVTESLLLVDEDLFKVRMRQLKTIGIRLAIDDFGTRYTAFNLLRDLPLDAMKIDRCFVRGIHRSQDMRSLCDTIVAMARQMKLRTVAEGIEETEEMDVMQQIGCEAGQGYLFERGLASKDFIAFMYGWPDQTARLGFSPGIDGAVSDPLTGTA